MQATAPQRCGSLRPCSTSVSRPFLRPTCARPFTPAQPTRRGPSCRLVAKAQQLDDDNTSIAELEAQLKGALAVEDYQLAARLRDSILQLQTVGKLAVEDANRKFYEAFTSGRIELMEKIVGQGEHVQCVHPGSNCIAGREQVMQSWKAILRNVRPNAFKVKLEDVRVYAGETSGFVTCVEVIENDDSQGRIVATNIFEKQGKDWVLVQHHGSPAARFR